MKRKILTTALALMALTFTFNSCKEDDDEFAFPYESVNLSGDMVVYSLDDLRISTFCSTNESDYEVNIFVGTDPSVDSTFSRRIENMLPYRKYYWYAQVTTNNGNDCAVSEMHAIYYLPAPNIAVHNVEGDWAAVVTWEHNDIWQDATITLTPDKDCEYDKTPIIVSAAQDSCYISAGSEFSKKYAVYHQWWDDSKAQYYEPVVYNFTATFSGEIDGIPYTVATEPVKYIFLDRAVYAADKQFNVYRMGRIGNRTWLLEDLRGNPGTLTKNFVLATSPSGFKAGQYLGWEIAEIIPEGCHLASDADWQDLEYTYGVEKCDYSSYYVDEYAGEISNRFSLSGIKNFEIEKDDTVKYVGQNVNIMQMLISKGEWISIDSTQTIINGLGGFNARPYGIQGYLLYGKPSSQGQVSVYLTSTIDEANEEGVIRVIWSGNRGIGREYVKNDLYFSIRYLLRCVKDE